jgi:predicted DNA-binding helix-hairpin-helix protein
LAVVGLNVNTFKPHTGTKTSVLFVQKWNNDAKAGPLCPKVEDYPIFFAVSEKSGKDILGSMALIRSDIESNRVSLPAGRAPAALPMACGTRPRLEFSRFAPAGQSTQLVVGASPESDSQILRLTEQMYGRFRLRRVYYSAYVPVARDARLPVLPGPPLRRENRLYQADWLLRFYGFKAAEILEEDRPFLDLDVDPKCSWALRPSAQ